ncbi:MAG: lipopolysaccharide assembly protein LapA domain-containing protein [Chitinophagales bacterium]
MQRTYLITIFLLLIALIFAIQNTTAISIKFLMWNFGGSQALIIAIILLLGFVSGWLVGLSKVWKKNSEIKALNKKISGLESNNSSSQK